MSVRRFLSIVAAILLAFVALTYMRQNGVFPFRRMRGPGRGTPLVRVGRATTRIVRPLRQDGYVDYWRALNEIASDGVTPDNNAVVLCWRAWGPGALNGADRTRYFNLLGMPVPPKKGDYFVSVELQVVQAAGLKAVTDTKAAEASLEMFHESLTRAMRKPWRKDDFPNVHAWLDRNKKPLDLLVQASRRPRWYDPLIPAADSEMLMLARRPASRLVSTATHALCARAMLAVGAGRTDAALRDLVACHRLARLVGTGPAIFDLMYAADAQQAAFYGDTTLLSDVALRAQQTHTMLDHLRQLPPLPDLADRIDHAERFSFLDSLCAMAREGPDAFDNPKSKKKKKNVISSTISSLGISALDWNHMLELGNKYFDRCVEVARRPTRAARAAELKRIEAELGAPSKNTSFKSFASHLFAPRSAVSEAVARILVSLVISSQGRESDVVDTVKMRAALVELAYALAAYRADHGQCPKTLAALAPDYIAKVPVDVFNDRPLHYMMTDSGCILYSVGPDGKDNGGKPAAATVDSRQKDTDIVIRIGRADSAK